MGMKKKFDAVATIGKYTNSEGEEKKRYLTVGAVLEREDGSYCLKVDAMPVSPEWSGWINLYPPKRRKEGFNSPSPSTPPPPPTADEAPPSGFGDGPKESGEGDQNQIPF